MSSNGDTGSSHTKNDTPKSSASGKGWKAVAYILRKKAIFESKFLVKLNDAQVRLDISLAINHYQPLEASGSSRKSLNLFDSHDAEEVDDDNRSMSLFPEADGNESDSTIENEKMDEDEVEFVSSGQRPNSLGLSDASGLTDVKNEFFSSAEQSNSMKQEFLSLEQTNGESQQSRLKTALRSSKTNKTHY